MIMVSKCLCGVNCKYSGGNNYRENIAKLKDKDNVILVCPEILHLPTPRKPVEIIGGSAKDVLRGKVKVMAKDGTDVTEEFVKGAYEILDIAKKNNVKKAILKANSPSCGYGKIYDGNFNGTLTDGNGVTAQLLSENGIEIFNESNFNIEDV